MNITVHINGDKVFLGLKQLPGAVEDVRDDEMEEGVEEATKEASGGGAFGGGYTVPQRSGQTYVRTGNLGRSTSYTREGLSYRFKSDAVSPRGQAYSKYVLGDGTGKGQAGVHRGRWPIAYEVMKKWADKIARNIDKGIGAAARGLGL